MKTLWSTIVAFFARLVGVKQIPPEVQGTDANLSRWWDIYRHKAPWLDHSFVDAAGVRRTRRRKSLNAAKIVCSELAGLVLAEAPEVKAGALVEELIARERLWDNLKKSTEFQAALGAQALKVTLGTGPEGTPQVGLDFVRASSFIPLAWDNAQVYEAAFIDRRVQGKKTLIRVETHRRVQGRALVDGEGNAVGQQTGYDIENRVFDEQTGLEVALKDFEEALEPLVFVPITRPLFAYIRNPEANNVDPESPAGLSVFANAVDTLETIDLIFDGMKTEVIMGRQRVALPSSVMRGYIDESGKRRVGFDPTDEAYVRLEGDDADKLKPVDLSGQLRMDAYRLGLQTALDLLSVQVGFSAGYLTFDGQAVKTATEVISDNSKTFKTVAGLREQLDLGLKQLFSVINEVGAVYGIEGHADTEPELVWDDSVIESRDARAAYWTGLVQAKLSTRVRAIRAVHGLSEEEAAAESEAIKKETAVVVDPFGAGPGA